MHVRSLALTLTILLGASAATSATAQSSVKSDVRCMLTMSAVQGTPEQKQAAQMGVYFFAGRLRAQNPSFDYATALRNEAAQMKVSDFQAALTPCGNQVKAVIQSLAAAQAALKDLKIKQ